VFVGGFASTLPHIQYALETVVQLLENGGFNCSSINLLDKPAFHHRGLLVDTASRFVPVGTLKTIIDAMLMAKMNVLNMRVAGNGAVRVESSFPELTAHVDGFYTSDDITSLVEYAHLRGVMIIPEVRVPMHRYVRVRRVLADWVCARGVCVCGGGWVCVFVSFVACGLSLLSELYLS
jgi:hexosaminidase